MHGSMMFASPASSSTAATHRSPSAVVHAAMQRSLARAHAMANQPTSTSRPRRASRDRAWTDSTQQQPTTTMYASPNNNAHYQQQQYHMRQQQQFPTTARPQPSHASRPSVLAARTASPSTTQPQAPRMAASPPPTVEWRVAIDPKSKRPYYYHPITRQTTWKKPQELVDKEKSERASFFAAMESNIRAKLRDGNWFRDSLTSRPSDLGDLVDDSDGELSSSTSTSSRSSWSSTNNNDVASVPSSHKPRNHQNHQNHDTRSLPTSPALDGKDNQADNDQDAASLLRAAAKPPMLFRTLSSYETPVVNETKKLVNGRLMTVPSPIVERVRLAGMDEHERPRASDLEAYTRPTMSEIEPEPETKESPTKETGGGIVRRPLRRRSNSTSTIYVRMGTMNAPDQDTTIQCIATVLRAHLMEAQAAPIQVDGKFELFVNRRDQRANAIPSLKDIGVFIKHIFSRAQMESECIIMSLIYVERLLKATMGSLQLQPGNWRAILFCSMVMASKVWDDLSMCNADFSKIWPELSLKEINELELAYLGAVEYNVRVSAVSYAKYYFHLRSMCASMGMLKSFDESAPLNLDGARKMQVLSEEYQERTKLMPSPSRRRSVTITTPAPGGVDPRAVVLEGGVNGPTKWSPTASLEQLVQMQSRVAGGTSLATMHRLSTSSSKA